MGQSFSSGRRRTVLPSSPLLQLPIEILLLITTQLNKDPESIVALALTCKALYATFISEVPALRKSARKSFLFLLEKDVGNQFYFCFMCYRLHRFSKSWRPLTYGRRTANGRGVHTRSGLCDTYFSLNGYYNLNYHLARLVMNRHFYGDSFGIPLDNLNLDIKGSPETWRLTWSAKVIGDELFLRVEHRFSDFRKGVMDQSLRMIVDQRFPSRICYHTHSSSRTLPELRRPSADGTTSEAFVECRNVVRSCRFCLTDFVTTIERKEVREKTLRNGRLEWYEPQKWNRKWPSRTSWVITITGYHRFGSCRSPRDWKWRAITGDGMAQNRDETIYPPGSVRNRWLASLEVV